MEETDDTLTPLPSQDQLVRFLIELRDDREQRQILALFAAFNQRDLHSALSRIVADQAQNVHVRGDALNALLRMDAVGNIPLAFKLLSEPDRALRQTTCVTIYYYARRGDRQAIERITEVLRSDSMANMRGLAAVILRKIGDRSALPALQHTARYDHASLPTGHVVSALAHEAIETIEEREQSSEAEHTELVRTLADREQNVNLRANALAGLLGLDSVHYLPTILEFLADPNKTLRWSICYELAHENHPLVIQRMTEVLWIDPDVSVRCEAATALRNISDASALPTLQYTATHDHAKSPLGYLVSDVAKMAIETILERERGSTDETE